METNNNTYQPFHPVHPFEILEDELEARGIAKKDFAAQLGMQPSNFSRMLRERKDLTASMALRLEQTLGIPFSHWMKFQESYLKDLARLKPEPKKTDPRPFFSQDNRISLSY